MGSADFEIRNVVGRLVVVRVRTLGTPEDVSALGGAMRTTVQGIAGPIVICGDYRAANVLAQPVADVFVAMLTTYSPRIERSAILLAAEHATLNLQIERLVRAAGHPSRRTFRSTRDLIAWLREVLTPAERAAAAEFLSHDA
jgi:hypothetical protein